MFLEWSKRLLPTQNIRLQRVHLLYLIVGSLALPSAKETGAEQGCEQSHRWRDSVIQNLMVGSYLWQWTPSTALLLSFRKINPEIPSHNFRVLTSEYLPPPEKTVSVFPENSLCISQLSTCGGSKAPVNRSTDCSLGSLHLIWRG